MTLEELLEALGGEIVRDVPRYRTKEGYVVLAKRNGNDFVFTEEGRRLAAELTPPKPRRTRANPEEIKGLSKSSGPQPTDNNLS